MKLAAMAVLSEAEIRDIHNSTLDILSGCGVKVLSPRMLDVLKAKWLPVDTASRTVRFSRAVLEDALACSPSRIEVFGRDLAMIYAMRQDIHARF